MQTPPTISPATPAVAGPAPRENALDRSVEILDFLHRNQEPMTPAQLARELGAPRSTIYKLVRTMTALGLLETMDELGHVFFGKKLYLYGVDYLRENDLLKRGRVEVDRLARETGETAELCMLQDGKFTIVHSRVGTRPFRISSDLGLQFPLPWTASGRLLLSDFTNDEIGKIIKPDDLVLPNGTQIEFDDFAQSVSEARSAGHCIIAGLVDAFTRCLAAPIYGATGRVEATICLVIPVDMPQPGVDELLRTLVERAMQLSVDRVSADAEKAPA